MLAPRVGYETVTGGIIAATYERAIVASTFARVPDQLAGFFSAFVVVAWFPLMPPIRITHEELSVSRAVECLFDCTLFVNAV